MHREIDETPKLNTYIQTSPDDGAQADAKAAHKLPPHVLMQPGASHDEELESLLEQARAIAKAQGRELTEVEASFIGVGSALNTMLSVVQHVQEQVLALAAQHVALEKRFDELEKKLERK